MKLNKNKLSKKNQKKLLNIQLLIKKTKKLNKSLMIQNKQSLILNYK